MIIITKGTLHYDRVVFVAKAIGEDNNRYCLSVIKAENGKIYATDGHRMHIAEFDLADGLYIVKKVKAEYLLIPTELPKDKQIFDYEKVMPSDVDKPNSVAGGYDAGQRQSKIIIAIYEHCQAMINADYVKDLPVGLWIIHGTAPIAPVKLICESMTAILMPFRA